MSTDEKMLGYLKALGVPPMTSEDDLKAFMTDYGVKKPKEPGTGAAVKAKAEHVPRISIFFGEEQKGEVYNYDTWAYEVRCLRAEGSYSDEVLLQAIRRSLKGHAADQLRYLGVKPSIEAILDSFNSTYGMIETPESILKKFYACKQSPNETVSSYCIRIEAIHAKALEMGALTTASGMLKRVFHKGLTPQLRHLSGYKFEMVPQYGDFKREVRQIENELIEDDKEASTTKPEPTKAKCHAVNKKEEAEPSKLEKQLGNLTSMMQQMNTRMEHMEKIQEQHTQFAQQPEEFVHPAYQQQFQPYHSGTPFQQSHSRMPFQQQQETQPDAQFNQYYNQHQSQQQAYTFRPVGFRGQKHFRGSRSSRPRGQGPHRGQGRGDNSYHVQTPIAGNTFMPECWAGHRRGHLARDYPSNFRCSYCGSEYEQYC